jgi:hypothetical protein
MMDQPFIIDPTPPVTSQLRLTTHSIVVLTSRRRKEETSGTAAPQVLARTLNILSKLYFNISVV